jgi:hypothetical protein
MKKIGSSQFSGVGFGKSREVCLDHPLCHFHLLRSFGEALRGCMEEEEALNREKFQGVMNLAYKAMTRILVQEVASGSTLHVFHEPKKGDKKKGDSNESC